jgi:hypothetical protein
VRAAVLVIALSSAVSSAAHAETKPPAPDANTDFEASEANLESTSPRSGLMFAFAGGFGVLIGGNIGVGRGGAVSLRVGHKATRSTQITFEFSGTGALHRIGTNDAPTTDSNAGLFAGAQTYLGRATWVRLAAGPTVFTANANTSMQYSKPGFGGLVGGGLDLARWGYVVLGFESFAMASMTRDGFKMQLGFAFGLSYY